MTSRMPSRMDHLHIVTPILLLLQSFSSNGARSSTVSHKAQRKQPKQRTRRGSHCCSSTSVAAGSCCDAWGASREPTGVVASSSCQTRKTLYHRAFPRNSALTRVRDRRCVNIFSPYVVGRKSSASASSTPSITAIFLLDDAFGWRERDAACDAPTA